MVHSNVRLIQTWSQKGNKAEIDLVLLEKWSKNWKWSQELLLDWFRGSASSFRVASCSIFISCLIVFPLVRWNRDCVKDFHTWWCVVFYKENIFPDEHSLPSSESHLWCSGLWRFNLPPNTTFPQFWHSFPFLFLWSEWVHDRIFKLPPLILDSEMQMNWFVTCVFQWRIVFAPFGGWEFTDSPLQARATPDARTFECFLAPLWFPFVRLISQRWSMGSNFAKRVGSAQTNEEHQAVWAVGLNLPDSFTVLSLPEMIVIIFWCKREVLSVFAFFYYKKCLW